MTNDDVLVAGGNILALEWPITAVVVSGRWVEVRTAAGPHFIYSRNESVRIKPRQSIIPEAEEATTA